MESFCWHLSSKLCDKDWDLKLGLRGMLSRRLMFRPGAGGLQDVLLGCARAAAALTQQPEANVGLLLATTLHLDHLFP